MSDSNQSDERLALIGDEHLPNFSRSSGPPEIVGRAVAGIKAPDAWPTSQGQNTIAAIASTGIQSDHDDLSKNFIGTINFTNEPFDDDRNGHGTHYAGIASACRNGIGIVGVAPLSKIYSVKVLESNGSGSVPKIVEAMKWLALKRFDVVYFGFGSGSDFEELNRSLVDLQKAGTTIVAGHSHNNGQPSYPGYYECVISTADLNARDVEADLFVDVGYGEPTTDLGNKINRLPPSSSNSVPFVAGVVCLVRARFPELSPIAIRDRLIATADVDSLTGKKVINALRAVS